MTQPRDGMPEPAQDAILTLDQAAGLFDVSVKTFIKLLRDEDVPARKIGREWRFSREALLRWLGDGRSRSYSDSDQEQRRYFDALAPAYDQVRDQSFETVLLAALERFCPPADNGLSIDYGSGTGHIAQWVAANRGRVLALDVSSGMLAELNRQAAAKGLAAIATRLCEPGDVPAEDGQARCVYASLCLHHVPEPAETIRAFRRVLAQGGRLAVVEYDAYRDEQWQQAMHDTWPGISRHMLGGWLAEAGFLHPEVVWEQAAPEGRTAYLMRAEAP